MKISDLMGMPPNYSAHGGQVDHMMDVIHWFMLALFVGWTLFLLYTLYRFAQKRNPKASYSGVRSHLSSHLEIGVIIVEGVLLLGFAFPLWAERVDDWETITEREPVRARVVGYQYGWVYHYPGVDGVFGRVDPDLITAGTNEIGLDHRDPNAHDDFTTSILRVPVNRPVVLNVTSRDVIHNYDIIPMRVQQDAIPGKEISMWFTPTRLMETFVVCAQLCGEGHANMVGNLEVISDKEFREWNQGLSEGELKKNRPADESTALN